MKLKIFLLFVISFLLFQFCSEQIKEEKKWNLILKDGLLYNDSLATQPFTGHYKGTVMGKKIEYEVLNGKRDGIFVLYHENGILETQGYLKENKNHGEWKYFYPDGKLESTGIFKDDQPDSIWVWFNYAGTLIQQGLYKEGKKDGEWKFYDDSGNLFLLMKFKDDQVQDSIWYGSKELFSDSLAH